MADALAFCVRDRVVPAVEIRVNFGVFSGRNATQAEIDDLARSLREEVESFSISAEERHAFGGSREAVARQVVVEVPAPYAGAVPNELADRIVSIAESWAEQCIHLRDDLGELGSEL
jgi:hypothetical protein